MKLRVALIYGGRSGEHDISHRSAESIARGLDPAKYELSHFTISREGKWSPRPILPEPGAHPDIDVVFPVLHGTFGEDGTVQGLLELAGLPYVGAGVMASSVSMDKEVMKGVSAVNADFRWWIRRVHARQSRGRSHATLGFPVFVKPANLGSSVGISKAQTPELTAALRTASEYDRKIMVERGIIGRGRFECSVLGRFGPRAATPCEILPSREFYDYEDKYLLNKARIELPAKLTDEQTKEIQRLAVRCFEAVGCEGMGRVDFLMEASTGMIYANEINTIPGFTSISMYPKMWEYSGISYSQLLDQLIDLAIERHQARSATRFTR